MVARYLVYETFHYCCHVHDNIRAQHARMKYMNLTFPVTDWLLGNSDLRRGRFGPPYYRYSEYVNEELRPIINKFHNDHSRMTLDGPTINAARWQPEGAATTCHERYPYVSRKLPMKACCRSR